MASLCGGDCPFPLSRSGASTTMAHGLCLHCHDGGGVHAESQSLPPALIICGPYEPPPPPLVSCSAKNRTQGLIPVKQLPSLLTPYPNPTPILTALIGSPEPAPSPNRPPGPLPGRKGKAHILPIPDSLPQSPGAFRWLLPKSHPVQGPLHRLSQKSILLFTEMGMPWHLDPTLWSLIHTVSTGGRGGHTHFMHPEYCWQRATGTRTTQRGKAANRPPEAASSSRLSSRCPDSPSVPGRPHLQKGRLRAWPGGGVAFLGVWSNNGRGSLSRGVACSLGTANSGHLRDWSNQGVAPSSLGAWSFLGGSLNRPHPFGGVANSGCGLFRGTVSSRGVASSYWSMAKPRGVAVYLLRRGFIVGVASYGA